MHRYTDISVERQKIDSFNLLIIIVLERSMNYYFEIEIYEKS